MALAHGHKILTLTVHHEIEFIFRRASKRPLFSWGAPSVWMHRSKLDSYPARIPKRCRETKRKILKGVNTRKQNNSVWRFRKVEMVWKLGSSYGIYSRILQRRSERQLPCHAEMPWVSQDTRRGLVGLSQHPQETCTVPRAVGRSGSLKWHNAKFRHVSRAHVRICTTGPCILQNSH